MSNKDMSALNDALHRQLNRLGSPDFKDGELQQELERTDAIVKVSKEIINNGRLLLDASIAQSNSVGILNKPSILEDKSNEG